jgi:NNP family nitrate/nitrite transporter-like MFS transporter
VTTAEVMATQALAHHRGTPARRVLSDWRPEDKAFWERQGKGIAARNLAISIPALLLAFAVWMVWSVTVVHLPDVGFPYTTNQLFWLAALPGLSGATLRIVYSFMVPIFGGRRWTALSTASLLLPALGLGFAVQDPETPYGVMAALALSAGLGGGNFASSMANVSFFYPRVQKGTALGLNAGLGNLGVSLAQFAVPLVIAAGIFGGLGGEPQLWVTHTGERLVWLQNAGFIWVPFVVLASLAAWFGMHDIASVRATFREQAVIFRRKHMWVMSWLYVATLGSFIGYAAGLPLLTRTQFPDVNATQYAFLGPLLGALMLPVGGWLSDRLGGGRVTLWTFVVMVLAVLGVLHFLPGSGSAGSFLGFLAMFLVLFVTTGIGNGSTFRMVPVICLTLFERETPVAAEAGDSRQPLVRAAAVLGFSSALGAYGAFLIPAGFGTSIAGTGGPELALYAFIAYYLSCLVLTWWYYARPGAEVRC